MKITFVIIYFGQWPFYTNLFIQSCRFNSCANFLIFSDYPPPGDLSSNIKHVYLDILSFQQRISEVLSINVNIQDPHKVCDFRGFFPYMFTEYLQDSDFWGYCDIDVVFGDLSKVLNAEYLEKVDVLTAYPSYITGHFSIFRNNKIINDLAFQIDNYKERANILQSTHMDENGISTVIKKNQAIRLKQPQPLLKELVSGKDFVPSCINLGFKAQVTDFPNQGNEVAWWKNGKVFFQSAEFKQTEALYIHFMGLKRYPFYWKEYEKTQCYDEFSFSQIGFSSRLLTPSALSQSNLLFKRYLFYSIARGRELLGHSTQRLFGISNARKFALFVKKNFRISI